MVENLAKKEVSKNDGEKIFLEVMNYKKLWREQISGKN
jgi:hypothetical protein